MSENHQARTALIVDDEAYFRRFVGELMHKASFGHVVDAHNGREALARFAELRPDLVILDINMPHLNGLETLVEIRRLSLSTPIIMLTSIAEEVVVEECVDQGATYFIRKDVPAGALAEELGRAITECFSAKDIPHGN